MSDEKKDKKTTKRSSARNRARVAVGDVAAVADTEPAPVAVEPVKVPPATKTEPKPAPSPAAMPAPRAPLNVRDLTYEAVYMEARDRGMNDRDARSTGEDVCDRMRLNDAEGDHQSAAFAQFIDLRSQQDYVYPNGKRKAKLLRSGAPVMREPKEVDSIVIHQTACEFGVSRRAVSLFGDAESARAQRALDVACHALAFRNGYFVAAHDLRVYVNHANRLNDRSLGLEIEGRYPGLMDDPATVAREDLKTTWGGKPTVLTAQTVETACAALKWLVDEGRRYSMPIQYIFAHRQSSDTRRSDPGQEIWQRVVLDYAVPVLGLKTQPETLWRQGYSIPTQWDPAGKGSY